MSLFKWWPLGGLGEVGMNCMLFQFGEALIPVDAGILFADQNDLGIEALYPDFDDVLTRFKPKHWLITHAHEDHIGAVAAVLSRCYELGLEPPEFLAPPFAAALIREKIKEDVPFRGASRYADKIKSVEVNSVHQLGDVEVRFIETRHSTADTCSLAFKWTNAQGQALRVIHTADFKLDKNEFEDGVVDATAYQVFGRERPDFLFIDSTNAERPGRSVSERDIVPGLDKLLRDQPGRVFVTLFSSNLYRVASLLSLAQSMKRQVCLAGRSLQTAFRLAEELGIFAKAPSFKGLSLLSPEQLAAHPADKQMIICSGSQGETRSVLNKLANSQHPHFVLQPGDSVIFSSKMIPGNEKPTSRLINGLLRLGAKVYWGDFGKMQAGGPIHASGHARADEIREVMETLQPKNIIPVHGELRQLRACAEIAHSAGRNWQLDPARVLVVENGTQLLFRSEGGEWELKEKIFDFLPPRILRFENFLAHSRDPFLKNRKRGAEGGFLSVAVDSEGRYRVQHSGILPVVQLGEGFSEEVGNWVHAKMKEIRRSNPFSVRDPQLELDMAEDLSRHVRRMLGVRPVVALHFMPD